MVTPVHSNKKERKRYTRKAYLGQTGKAAFFHGPMGAYNRLGIDPKAAASCCKTAPLTTAPPWQPHELVVDVQDTLCLLPISLSSDLPGETVDVLPLLFSGKRVEIADRFTLFLRAWSFLIDPVEKSTHTAQSVTQRVAHVGELYPLLYY